MLADGNKYFNRSGTTIADTVEILAEILHGAGGSYHQTAWRNYSELGEVAETLRRHADACAAAQSTYIDPATGYQVFTADFLRSRGTCCGKGCRHCPYSHALVKSS
jgi:ATP-binding cassette subfamily B (MDR/TAP) protein 1